MTIEIVAWILALAVATHYAIHFIGRAINAWRANRIERLAVADMKANQAELARQALNDMADAAQARLRKMSGNQ